MKTLKTLFALIAMIFCNASLFAHDFEVDGIYYNITSEADKTVDVGCKGSYWSSSLNEYNGYIFIPNNVCYDGEIYTVKGIGNAAFMECKGLKKISIPNSVTNIGRDAFQYCI